MLRTTEIKYTPNVLGQRKYHDRHYQLNELEPKVIVTRKMITECFGDILMNSYTQNPKYSSLRHTILNSFSLEEIKRETAYVNMAILSCFENETSDLLVEMNRNLCNVSVSFVCDTDNSSIDRFGNYYFVINGKGVIDSYKLLPFIDAKYRTLDSNFGFSIVHHYTAPIINSQLDTAWYPYIESHYELIRIVVELRLMNDFFRNITSKIKIPMTLEEQRDNNMPFVEGTLGLDLQPDLYLIERYDALYSSNQDSNFKSQSNLVTTLKSAITLSCKSPHRMTIKYRDETNCPNKFSTFFFQNCSPKQRELREACKNASKYMSNFHPSLIVWRKNRDPILALSKKKRKRFMEFEEMITMSYSTSKNSIQRFLKSPTSSVALILFNNRTNVLVKSPDCDSLVYILTDGDRSFAYKMIKDVIDNLGFETLFINERVSILSKNADNSMVGLSRAIQIAINFALRKSEETRKRIVDTFTDELSDGSVLLASSFVKINE